MSKDRIAHSLWGAKHKSAMYYYHLIRTKYARKYQIETTKLLVVMYVDVTEYLTPI